MHSALKLPIKMAKQNTAIATRGSAGRIMYWNVIITSMAHDISMREVSSKELALIVSLE